MGEDGEENHGFKAFQKALVRNETNCHSGFEFDSPNLFPTTITVTLRAPQYKVSSKRMMQSNVSEKNFTKTIIFFTQIIQVSSLTQNKDSHVHCRLSQEEESDFIRPATFCY